MRKVRAIPPPVVGTPMQSIHLSSARAKAAPAVRYAMLLMAHRGDLLAAEQAAGRSFPTTPEVVNVLKSAVSAGTTTDTAWAAPLAAHAAVISGFVELQRAATVVGRLQDLRATPFNTRTLTTTAGSEAQFVGEGWPAPVTSLAFAPTTILGRSKVQCLVVVTSELVRAWSQASEDTIRADLVAATAAGIDRQFLDPSIGPSLNPGSITHGIVPRVSTGATVDAITTDLKALMTAQINAGNDLSQSVWVVSPRSALHISTLRDTAGQLAFEGASVLGGTLLGLPMLVSGAVALAGSPTDSFICLINPRRVLIADEGLATIDVSEHAALQMNDSPSAGGQALVSLWQQGLSAVRVTRYINWTRASDDAVSLLSDVQY